MIEAGANVNGGKFSFTLKVADPDTLAKDIKIKLATSDSKSVENARTCLFLPIAHVELRGVGSLGSGIASRTTDSLLTMMMRFACPCYCISIVIACVHAHGRR